MGDVKAEVAEGTRPAEPAAAGARPSCHTQSSVSHRSARHGTCRGGGTRGVFAAKDAGQSRHTWSPARQVCDLATYKAVMAEDTKLVNFMLMGTFPKLHGEFAQKVCLL